MENLTLGVPVIKRHSIVSVRMLFLCFDLDAWSSPALISFVDFQRFMSLHHALVESLNCAAYILSHYVLFWFISWFYLISFICPVRSSVSQSIHSLTVSIAGTAPKHPTALPVPRTSYKAVFIRKIDELLTIAYIFVLLFDNEINSEWNDSVRTC